MKCIEYTGTQDYERALQSIRRAVELRPKNTEYHAQMARVLIHMPGHNKQAEKEFLIAIELDAENPDLPDLFVELSDLYRKFGMAQRADEMLQRALDKDPTHHDANQRLEKYAPPPETGWKKTGGRFGALVGKMFNKDKGNT